MTENTGLGPQELFRLLEDTEYPAHGYELAKKAEEMGLSEELQDFLNGIPGEIEDRSTVIAHLQNSKMPAGYGIGMHQGKPKLSPEDITGEADQQ